MNRILNGESFPKPGMLKRICEYFNTDARILLQPLDELEQGSFRSHDADISSVWNYTMFGWDYFVPENMLQDILPDGLHLMYRPSFLMGTQIWIGMVRVFGQNGVRMLRGLDPVAPGMRRSDLTPISVREYRGMMLQTNEALSFVYAARVPSGVMGVDNFSTRTWTTRGFFQGRCMIMSSANPIGKKPRSLHFAAAGTIYVGCSERGAQDWVLSDCGDSSKIPNLSCIRRVVIGRRLSAPNRFQSTKYFGQSLINGIGDIVDVVGC